MGLSYSDGEWKWNNAGSLTNESFHNWADGQPNVGNIAYLVFSEGGQWASSYEYNTGVPICEKLKPTCTPPTPCTPPWIQISSCQISGCYQTPRAGSWYNGEEICQELGGYLVEIDTKEEEDTLKGDFIGPVSHHCLALSITKSLTQ